MAAISRTSIVAMLVAVEVLIVGMVIWSFTDFGGRLGASGFHRVDYVAPAIAPIAAGIAPVVTIDDTDSNIVLGNSNDGLVHVTDKTVVHGWIAGSDHAQVLTATKTTNGVRIVRPEGQFFHGYDRK